MKAAESIPAIEAFGHGLSHQNKVMVDKVISSLRDKDKSDGSAVKKQIEDLSEKVRKLEDQLQSIAAKVEPASDDDDKKD